MVSDLMDAPYGTDFRLPDYFPFFVSQLGSERDRLQPDSYPWARSFFRNARCLRAFVWEKGSPPPLYISGRFCIIERHGVETGARLIVIPMQTVTLNKGTERHA